MMAKDSEEQFVAEMSFDDLKNEIISNLESVDVIVKASESSKGTCRLDIQTRDGSYELVLRERD